MGVGVFEIEDGSGLWEIGGFFNPDPPDEVALAILAASANANPFVVSEVPEKDWVAEVRRELAPIEAGRFFLYGSHDADKVPADRIALLIEAAMAFGTGHHGTTKGCLIAYDELLNAGHQFQNIADIGCGTAVLAMAAAKVSDVNILASDIDEVATDTARANMKSNDLEGKVHIVTCPGFEHGDIAAAAPFDLVFANILKGPLIGLAPDMSAHVAPNGFIILSGILNEQAGEVTDVYEGVGFTAVEKRILGEWSTLTMQRV